MTHTAVINVMIAIFLTHLCYFVRRNHMPLLMINLLHGQLVLKADHIVVLILEAISISDINHVDLHRVRWWLGHQQRGTTTFELLNLTAIAFIPPVFIRKFHVEFSGLGFVCVVDLWGVTITDCKRLWLLWIWTEVNVTFRIWNTGFRIRNLFVVVHLRV